MSDSRHHFTWIPPWIWGLCHSAIKANCRVICWICEVKTHGRANEVSPYPVFWFLFSESYAASFQADRVRGNRSAGQQSFLCILQLLDIFITVFIEVTLNGWKKEKRAIRDKLCYSTGGQTVVLYSSTISCTIWCLMSLTFQARPHIYILTNRTCVLSI